MNWKTGFGILASAVLLAACGGGGGAGTPLYGGGGGGGTPSGAPTLSIALKNSQGVSTQSTVGNQNYTVEVTVKDASGGAVTSKAVAVSSDDFTFTPTNGQSLTNSSGVASFATHQASSTASGATQICAKATVGTTSLASCLDVQMGLVAAELGTFSTVSGTVAAYQSIQLTIPVTYSGTSTPAVGVPVTFSASCGTVSPTSAITDSTGIAKVSYTNDNSGSTCSGSTTVTASTDASTKNVVFTTSAAVAANIQFIAATPSRIYLQGSPGVSTSVLKFKLLDQNSNKMTGQSIVLDFVLRPAGASLREAGTSQVSATTDSNGEVSVTVLAGSAPGPVQVRATFTPLSGPSISNVSNGLSIASGLPTQDRFSLSVSTFNIEAWHEDGVETFLTVRVADRLGNPVPDNTPINFISEGGQVVASCLTTGAADNKPSACSVTMSSQNPRGEAVVANSGRPSGRITILAWAQGEESFVDNSQPSNNVYDAGTDTYTEIGQPYLDRNFDNVYDAGEETVGRASGTSACGSVVGHVKPNTCDGAWGSATVFATTEIVFSDDSPDPTQLNLGQIGGLPAGRCGYSVTLKDLNGNPLPAGTTLTTSDVSGGTFLAFGGEGNKVPNTNSVNRTTHTVLFGSCPDVNSLSFTLKVKTPKGVETGILIP